jgi:hypothetical protein
MQLLMNERLTIDRQCTRISVWDGQVHYLDSCQSPSSRYRSCSLRYVPIAPSMALRFIRSCLIHSYYPVPSLKPRLLLPRLRRSFLLSPRQFPVNGAWSFLSLTRLSTVSHSANAAGALGRMMVRVTGRSRCNALSQRYESCLPARSKHLRVSGVLLWYFEMIDCTAQSSRAIRDIQLYLGTLS